MAHIYIGSKSVSGPAGYTPQKGIDYLTDEDKADIISLINFPTVDGTMSDSSENAVQNKVVKSYIDNEISNISFQPTSQVTSVNGEVGDIVIDIPTMDEIYNEMELRFARAEEAVF